MWVITTTGFYSIVRKPGDEQLCIRSRVRKDLVDLKKEYLPTLGKIIDTKNSDYRYRAYAEPDDVSTALAAMAKDIDYSNFKDEVKHRQGQGRASVYMRIWSALLDLQPLRKHEKHGYIRGLGSKQFVHDDAIYDPRDHEQERSLMKCCSKGCKRDAVFVPKIVIPHSATAPVKADLAFEMLERSPVCAKHFHHIDINVRLADPKFIDFIIRLALTQAMRLRRQFERPDFTRAFLVKVDVTSNEYKSSSAS